MSRGGGIMAVVALTKENFHNTLEQNKIVLIDFWAAWCGPCRMFAPVYDKVSGKHPDIVFGRVDTEDARDLSAEYQIMSIPTLMIFKESILVFRQSGALPEKALDDLVSKVKQLDMDQVRADMAKDQ
jgi:thioredoxin 1